VAVLHLVPCCGSLFAENISTHFQNRVLPVRDMALLKAVATISGLLCQVILKKISLIYGTNYACKTIV